MKNLPWIAEGSLEVKLPTIGTDEKAEVGRAREEKRREEENREEDQRRERVKPEDRRKIEDAGARKKWQRRETLFLQWFVAAEGRKVGSLKRRVRSCLGRWEMKNCSLLWREAHFQVKMYKTHHVWTLRCRKSARRCGAKHISKSKCTKHTRFGALLEVQMSKKCTSLWHETYFQVKSAKNWRLRNTFGRSGVVSPGRRKGLCT